MAYVNYPLGDLGGGDTWPKEYQHLKPRLDLTGFKVHKLTFLYPIDKNADNKYLWQCICECGQYAQVPSSERYKHKSCGCVYKTQGRYKKFKNTPKTTTINMVLRDYKRNAQKRELDFELTFEQFSTLIFSNCYFCGAKPSRTLSKYQAKTSNKKIRQEWVEATTIAYNGIDRLNNTLGYSIDNCVPCCKICNIAKSDMTEAAFIDWAKQVVKNYGLHSLSST